MSPAGHVPSGGGVRLKAPEGVHHAPNEPWVRARHEREPRLRRHACTTASSGGPNFVVLGGERRRCLHDHHRDVPCYATNVTYRTDSPTARAFLADYVALPGSGNVCAARQRLRTTSRR